MKTINHTMFERYNQISLTQKFISQRILSMANRLYPFPRKRVSLILQKTFSFKDHHSPRTQDNAVQIMIKKIYNTFAIQK